MTGAQYILQFLQQQGCHDVFGYPGGAIMPLYDALLDFDIKHYLARHEQGAAFSAVGFARSSNKPGICFGTSGPGATNLLTALADAKLDSVPILVITGQVPSSAMGSDAFQEVDVLGLSLSVTKHSFLVSDIAQLPSVLPHAYQLCQEGRPGPVLVDIPKDILLTALPEDTGKSLNTFTATKVANSAKSAFSKDIEKANQLLQQAQKPLAYLGGGIAMADALPELRAFLRDTQLPCVSTLKGLGTAADNYPLDLGMLGMHGLKAANLAVQECDLLLVLGARLDDRATGKLNEFAPNAKVVHVDIDAAEIDKRRFANVAIAADCKDVIPQLTRTLSIAQWQHHLSQQQKTHQWQYNNSPDKIDAPWLLSQLNQAAPRETVYTSDVGQHQMWVAQHLQFSSPKHHLSSGGLGTMGFGMPAGIGACVANPDKCVVTISGDGSFMMNIQELATIKRYGIPLKILVLDNQRLGMVKQWQELFHGQRYSETDLSDNPEFSEVAAAFGIHSAVLDKPEDMKHMLAAFIAHPEAMLLHVKLNAEDNVWPIVPPNTANHHMLEEHHAISN
ncbi:MAG: acetolactate synthase 2 catalytic subunit [Aestuariibacter sp.]